MSRCTAGFTVQVVVVMVTLFVCQLGHCFQPASVTLQPNNGDETLWPKGNSKKNAFLSVNIISFLSFIFIIFTFTPFYLNYFIFARLCICLHGYDQYDWGEGVVDRCRRACPTI